MRRRDDVPAKLRERILNGVHFGSIESGDRLPSARQLSAELGTDPRVVNAAYRLLEREGFVARRPGARGFFALVRRAPSGRPIPTAEWLVSVLAEAIGVGISTRQFLDYARSGLETVRFRCTCFECNDDQLRWLCGELEDDYGFVSHGVSTATPSSELRHDPEVMRSDVLVTTAAHAAQVRAVGERLHKPVVLVTLKRELTAEVTELLTQGPLYLLCTDSGFVSKADELYHGLPNSFNLRTVLLGRDDPGDIPEGAPVWVMRRAREQLGEIPSHVRPLNTAALFSSETRRELLFYLVRANLRAANALQPAD